MKQFIRLYLNSVLLRFLCHESLLVLSRLESQATLASIIPELSAKDRQNLVLSTANPIMVETAALYFCLDLGLVADIGISKGIDVVDIRARAESQEKANQAVTWLLELKPDNIVVSESVRARLQTDWVLELQCKAADRRVDSTNILYFGYRRQTKGYEQENTISVQQLAHAFTHDPWQGGLLSRFLKLQERVLSLA